MHAVTMPDKSKNIRITLALAPWKVSRGHRRIGAVLGRTVIDG